MRILVHKAAATFYQVTFRQSHHRRPPRQSEIGLSPPQAIYTIEPANGKSMRIQKSDSFWISLTSSPKSSGLMR